jgi:hypothetical protein
MVSASDASGLGRNNDLAVTVTGNNVPNVGELAVRGIPLSRSRPKKDPGERYAEREKQCEHQMNYLAVSVLMPEGWVGLTLGVQNCHIDRQKRFQERKKTDGLMEGPLARSFAKDPLKELTKVVP